MILETQGKKVIPEKLDPNTLLLFECYDCRGRFYISRNEVVRKRDEDAWAWANIKERDGYQNVAPPDDLEGPYCIWCDAHCKLVLYALLPVSFPIVQLEPVR